MVSRSHSGGRAAATAAGLLALLVLAYLWRALLEGQLLAPTALLYSGAPWLRLAPAGLSHYFNGDLGDVPASYYPWDVLARRLIHAGTFPAWNPYAFAGTPFFANPEVAWLSPFSLPLWILPLNYGLGVAAALKLWVAGFGAYLLARELKLGFWPGMLAGISFTLCAFNVVWLSHGVFVSVAALLPWTIWLVERIVRRGRAVEGLALAAIVVGVLVGGHPGTQLHVLSGAALYALARTLTSGDVARRERLRRLVLVGAALALGALLSAVVLVPAQQLALHTVGAAARKDGSPGFAGSSMGLDALRTALFPDWWGRPSEAVHAGPANYKERTLYAGSATLVLALIALVSPGGWRRKAPFALLGALGGAVALNAPGLHTFVVHLPLFDRIQNQRILLWFEFAVAMLAAFGLQQLFDRPKPQRRVWAVTVAALLAGALAAVTLSSSGTVRQAIEHVLDRSRAHTPYALALASVIWWTLFVAVLAALLLLAYLRPDRRRLVAGLVALVVALDMLHFAHGYQPIGPVSKIVPPSTPALAFLRRHRAEGRIAGTGPVIAQDYTSVYGLRDVRGFDAPQPTFRFYHLWQLMDPANEPYSLQTLTPTSPKVLGLLGARYVILPAGSAVAIPGLREAYRGDDATIVANALAMPRAIVAARVHVAAGEDDELEAIEAARFDPRHDAVVRRDELSAATLPGDGGGGGSGSVRVVGERNAAVTLRARLPRAGLVVLDDAWAPGWSVTVDGRPARALQADVVLRGVVAPAGTHTIVWRYRVPGLRAGLALSGAGVLIALAWIGALVLRRRRARVGSTG